VAVVARGARQAQPQGACGLVLVTNDKLVAAYDVMLLWR
jgi:hypothetical protein